MVEENRGGGRRFLDRALDGIEWLGNKLPDPAVLFVLALIATWILSAALAGHEFDIPTKKGPEPTQVVNLLTGEHLVGFLTGMVEAFTGFHPLGVVLVAMLGIGVAEHAGFIDAALKKLLALTPQKLIAPGVVFAGVLSSTVVDAGYVLVIPLGGVIFYTAGRHPLAGIAAAFAGVSGGFSANLIPSGLDPLLQGLTQEGAAIIDPEKSVNVLCNFYFTAASCALIVAVAWYLTERVVEPRVRGVEVDGDPDDMPQLDPLTRAESRGLIAGAITMAAGLGLLVWACVPEGSPFRVPLDDEEAPGSITNFRAPLMQAIVPLIFFLFLLPGIVHGYVSGRFRSHRDVIQGMSKAMGTMSYYLVMAFCAALFIEAFNESRIGSLLAVEGAQFLKDLGTPATVTVIGIIILSGFVNLVVGSASAKWALLAPIFVPMLMQLGIAPELTQGAYRIGDSSTNIITPLMPYFPLVVAFAQRYVKSTGIGTLISLMLPYSVAFAITWTLFLILFWLLGIPLGLQGFYEYPAPAG